MSLESWLLEVPIINETGTRIREVGPLAISLQSYTEGWSASVDSLDYSMSRFGRTPSEALRKIEKKLLKDFPDLEFTFNPPRTALERILSDEEPF